MNTCIQFMTVFFCLLLPLPAAAGASELFAPLGITDQPARIVTVSPAGGDFTDPLAALASITDASADNPYLVLIGPGVYTVTETLAMKPFVDIAGAGREATKLTGAISSGAAGAASALVTGAGKAVIRNLTIENTGGGQYTTALHNEGASPEILDVAVSASGGSHNYGVHNHESFPRMNRVTVTVSGGELSTSYGVYNSSSSPEMVNVNVEAAGAWPHGVYNVSSSPNMTDVAVDINAESTGMGVYNESSDPVMTGVTVTAAGYAGATGVRNVDSSPIITDISVIVSAGQENYGVSSTSSFPVMRQSTVQVADPSLGEGIYVNGGITLVMQSSITGGVQVTGGGILSCVHADDGAAAPLGNTCE